MIPKDKLLHIGMGVFAVLITLAVIELARHNLGAALAVMTTTFGIFYEAQQFVPPLLPVRASALALLWAPTWCVNCPRCVAAPRPRRSALYVKPCAPWSSWSTPTAPLVALPWRWKASLSAA